MNVELCRSMGGCLHNASIVPVFASVSVCLGICGPVGICVYDCVGGCMNWV